MTQKERIEEINKLWEEIKNNNWLIQLMVSDQVFEDMREKLIIPSRDMFVAFIAWHEWRQDQRR